MSRADEFNAFYRESRSRLLVQVYAYAGDTEVAQRALADAYVAAGHHWRKLCAEEDKDAWMRAQAFKATGRAQNQPSNPWYVRARKTDDSHRPLLNTLGALDPLDRHLVILVHLAGLDLRTAAREAGLTDEAATESLARTKAAFDELGVDQPLTSALGRLRLDLSEEPVDRARRLQREGNRRRRANVVLAGLMSLAVVIGAGALTAAKTTKQPSPSTQPAPSSPTTRSPRQPPAAVPTPVSTVTADLLAPVTDLETFTRPRQWRLSGTSLDFGTSTPYDECLAVVPSDHRPEHFWVRTFSTGQGLSLAVANQAVEVSRSSQRAGRSYRRLIRDFSGCAAENHQVLRYARLRGVGDSGRLIAMRYVTKTGVHPQQVVVAKAGTANVVWVFDARLGAPFLDARLVRIAGASVRRICGEAAGRCGSRPYTAVEMSPPSVEGANGFLADVDLPLFDGLIAPWVAIPVDATRSNPAATECDRADFAEAGAKELRARSFVKPAARHLDAFFGMTQTLGTFGSVSAANGFVNRIDSAVQSCDDRQLSLEVDSDGQLALPRGSARTYLIELTLAEDRSLIFRMALIRVGSRVAQLTFTPAGSFDLTSTAFTDLVQRAALRIAQD